MDRMDRIECENKILLLLAEIANIYKEYNPDGDYLTLTVCGNSLSVNNDYWEFPNKQIEVQREVAAYKDNTFFNFESAWELEKKKVRKEVIKREYKTILIYEDTIQSRLINTSLENNPIEWVHLSGQLSAATYIKHLIYDL